MANDIIIRWLSESGQAIRDMSRVEKALKDTSTTQEKWARRWQTTADLAGKAGTAMFAGISVAAVRAGKAAAAQEQAFAGVGAVFRDQAPRITAWAAGMSDAGVSATDAAKAATTLGGAMKSAGLDMAQVATESPRLVEVAGQLAQVYGVDVTQAVEAMAGAFRGEYDSAQTMNIAISDAAVKAEMAARGWDKLTGKAYEQKRALAVLTLLMQGTTDAQDAAGKGAETAAAKMAKFKAKLDNIEASLGGALLPLMSDLADHMDRIATAAEKDPENVRRWAVGIAGVAAGLLILSTAAKAVTVMQGVSAVVTKFPAVKAWGWVGVIGALVVALKELEYAGMSWGAALEEYFNLDWADNLKEWVLPLAQVTDALGVTEGAADRLRAALAAPFKATIDAANDKALNAAARAENALRRVADGRYRATIDAANDRAQRAVESAQAALDTVERRTATATVDADDTPFRSGVGAAIGWANSQTATVRVRAVGAGAAIGAAAAAVTGYTRATAPAAARTATAAQPAPVVININGFTGDEDVLARRVSKALHTAAGRYGARGYMR